jgi:protein-ribulosamine 3-kinase
LLFESEIPFFQSVLKKGLHQSFEVTKIEHVGGGDINHAAKVTTKTDVFFIKWNQFPNIDMFELEAKGLDLLSRTKCIDVVKPLGFGQSENKNFLILEYLETGRQGKYFWEDFGQKLAKMHQCSQPQFGLDYNNYIGRLEQVNQPYDGWTDFFIEQRIMPMVAGAREKGVISWSLVQQFESLYQKLEELIPEEKPSLLHGDLWGGNFMRGPNHQAWLIDPAVYYGHREMEIAFTQLFGGFEQRFYNSYQEAFPLSPGFDHRVDIHNLYPLLVHVNLFGSSYLSGIMHTLKKFA